MDNQIIIYQTEDGQTRVDVRMENETVWLTANQMAMLFERDEKTVRKHINNVFSDGELEKDKRVCQNDAPLFLLLYVHRNFMQPNLNDFHHKVSLGFSISFEKGY